MVELCAAALFTQAVLSMVGVEVILTRDLPSGLGMPHFPDCPRAGLVLFW